MTYRDFMDKLTQFVMKITPEGMHNRLSLFKAYLFRGYGQDYYATDGIDAIIQFKLKNTKKIFYVDVGAFHPFCASNTYAMYRRGAKGINIDATPGQMKNFKIARRKDINLQVAVSDENKSKKFYIFNKQDLNGFSPQKKLVEAKEAILRKTITIPTKKLSEILDKYLPKKQTIHLLSIDVEGHDLNVLKSNDWNKYKPQLIVVEQFCESIDEILKTDIYKFLKSKEYDIVGFTGMNVLYERNSNISKKILNKPTF